MPDIEFPHVDPEGVDVETCLAQLRDPAVILAEALHRVHRADEVQTTIERVSTSTNDEAIAEMHRLLARQDHLTRTADSLAYIAKTAADMAAQGRQTTLTAVDDFLDDPEAMQVTPVRGYEPQAVNGVRFTAEISGWWLGYVGGLDWMYVSGYGFLNVSQAVSVAVPSPDNVATAVFRGRVVSATPDEALCITDTGFAITLPRALIVESADE